MFDLNIANSDPGLDGWRRDILLLKIRSCTILLAPLYFLGYISTLLFLGNAVTPNPVGSVAAAAVIKIASFVPKRGLVVGCFSRPDLPNLLAAELLHVPRMHNCEIPWIHFGSGTFTAELATIGQERGVLVVNSFELKH